MGAHSWRRRSAPLAGSDDDRSSAAAGPLWDLGGSRDRSVHHSALVGRGPNLQLAADRFDSVVHASDPHPVDAAIGLNSGAVVADCELDRVLVAGECDPHLSAGAGMLGGVLDRLPSTEIDSCLDRIW